MSLQLHCPAFPDGSPIPRRHTGDGEDLSPPLSWSDVPAETKELALVVDDPDAPTAEPWVHWVVYSIPASSGGLPEGVVPADRPPQPAGSLQGVNSWGAVGYRGPAPPRGHGVHHYHFRLHALDAPLGLLPGLDKRAVLKAISGHVLATGEYVGTYERSK
jgi:Raf kinase inhibitor-like YbhB/YbcL family protein